MIKALTDEVLYGDKYINDKVNACIVTIKDVRGYAELLIRLIQEDSWILDVDPYAKAAFERTVSDTTEKLVEIFNSVKDGNPVGKEFGELMVSIGSMRALEHNFSHSLIPLAELWKPKLSGNEGFDFHTVCKEPLINFGEAKYQSMGNPYRKALKQINDFLSKEKHKRDAIYLEKLVGVKELECMLDGRFGVVASFSVNAMNTKEVMDNAVKSIDQDLNVSGISNVYVVGVCYEAT